MSRELYTENDFNFYLDISESVENFSEKILNTRLNKDQMRILESFKSADQLEETSEYASGKTTLGIIISLHEALFKDGSKTVIKARDAITIEEILSRITEIFFSIDEKIVNKYLHLIKNRTRTKIIFENGSTITAYSNDDEARGFLADFVFIDDGKISTSNVMFSSAKKLALRTDV